MSIPTNVDPLELEKFSQHAHKWWDETSEFKPLHAINPLRLEFIQRYCSLAGKKALDVGCGGGILSEGLAKAGAQVTGIDLATKSVKIAKLHALDTNLSIDYQTISAESFAAEQANTFDVVVCMEMLEHVPDQCSIVTSCAQATKSGGWVFFSTLNRNLKSYLHAIIGAEYLLKMLPKGTHDYARFIKPSELLRMANSAHLEFEASIGIEYHPLSQRYALKEGKVDINYLMAFRKP